MHGIATCSTFSALVSYFLVLLKNISGVSSLHILSIFIIQTI